jgi:DNA topoisomerase-2
MTVLDKDIVSIMYKRVYDLAGITPSNVKVKLNGKIIEVKNFLNYVDLYLKTEETKVLPKIIERDDHERWEVVASLSDG